MQEKPVLTRINTTQVNNDILGTLTSDNDKKLDSVFRKINEAEKGAIVFINQEVKSLELLDRIAELKVLQSQGEMRAPQIKMDTKDFGIGAQILHDLDITKIELLSNSTAPTKRVGMIGYGLEITDYVNY